MEIKLDEGKRPLCPLFGIMAEGGYKADCIDARCAWWIPPQPSSENRLPRPGGCSVKLFALWARACDSDAP